MKKAYKKKTIVLLSASLLLASNIAPVLATTSNDNNKNDVPTEELDKASAVTTITNSGEKEDSPNNLVAADPKETASSLNTSTPTSESKTVTNINPNQEEQKETPIPTSDESIDSWMPDKNLQKAVLDNLISQGILPETATLSDVTRDIFTSANITLAFPTYSSFQSSGIQNLAGFETDNTMSLHTFLLGSYEEDIYSPQEVADSLNQLLIPVSQYLEVKAVLGNDVVTSVNDIKDMRVAYDSFWKHYQAGANVFLEDRQKLGNIVTTMVNLNQDNYKEFDVSLDIFKGVLDIENPDDYPTEDPEEVTIEINGQEVSYEINITKDNAHFKMIDDLDFSIFNHQTSSPLDLGIYTVWSGVSESYDSPAMGVILNYNEIAKQAGDITVRYCDIEGKLISENVVKAGNIGEDYTTEQKEIPGYTFKEVQGNASGKFTDQPQTVTYVYTKNEVPSVTGTVLVKYVDTEGNPISESVVKTGIVGDGYITEQKNIEGYTFKEVQGNSTGQFTEQSQLVTYVYTKDTVIPEQPEQQPDNKPNNHDKVNVETTHSAQDTLPKTGENDGMTFISSILGLVLLMVGVAVSVFRVKKMNK